MTQIVCRDLGVVLFVAFSVYGLLGTMRAVRLMPGPRTWALFALLELVEAVQVYALFASPSGRPEADIRSGAVIGVAALCYCAFLQRLYFVSVAAVGGTSFPRRTFYIASAVFLALVLALRYAAPLLP